MILFMIKLNKIIQIIEETFDNKQIQKYVLKRFASCLNGSSIDEKNICLHDIGSERLGDILELLALVFGEYC